MTKAEIRLAIRNLLHEQSTDAGALLPSSNTLIDDFMDDAVEDIGTDPGHWGSEAKYLRALLALSAHYLKVGTDSEYGDSSPGFSGSE